MSTTFSVMFSILTMSHHRSVTSQRILSLSWCIALFHLSDAQGIYPETVPTLEWLTRYTQHTCEMYACYHWVTCERIRGIAEKGCRILTDAPPWCLHISLSYWESEEGKNVKSLITQWFWLRSFSCCYYDSLFYLTMPSTVSYRNSWLLATLSRYHYRLGIPLCCILNFCYLSILNKNSTRCKELASIHGYVRASSQVP